MPDQDPYANMPDPYAAMGEPGAPPPPPAAKKPWLTSPDFTSVSEHQMPHSAADVGREVVRGVGNIGAAGLKSLTNLQDFIPSAIESSPPVQAYRDVKDAIARFRGKPSESEYAEKHPLETLENATGQAGASAVVGETLGAVGRAGKGVGRFITKTNPKVTEELVGKTKAENADIQKSNADAAKAHLDKTLDALHQTEGNELQHQQAVKAAQDAAVEENKALKEKHQAELAEAEADRKVDLKKHFQKTQEAKESNTAAEGKVSRKEAINRGVERLDTEVRGDLDKLEEKVNAEGNRRYNELNKTLKNEEADPYQRVNEQGKAIGRPVSLVEHLYEVASEPLRGTGTETSIIKSLAKNTENAEGNLTYNDLQGYREEVGRELRKGNLPPDVFTAYKNLMGAIDDAMGKIAERRGLKPQQDAARSYWREYRDTFLDSDSPFRKWKNAAGSPNYKPGMGANFIRNADTGIQAIAKYDPQLAQRLNNFRGYSAEAKGLPSSPGKLQSLPKLSPKPAAPEAPAPVEPKMPKPPERVAPPDRPPVTPEKKIGAEDIRQAKLTSLQEKGVPGVRKVGNRIVNYGVGLHALWDAFSGRVANLPRDIGLGLTGYAATEGFARLLERPDIQEMLSKPTPEDIAKIPDDLKGNLGPMLDAAKAKGIKVDPRLYAAAGTPQRKRVAAALQPAQ